MTLERRDVNLFPDEGAYTPRQAWQVIESARRQHLTGELSLDVDPPARLYLRDGEVYFAERTTDGALSVRLLVEGVLTRDQMNRGKVVVNGVEHLGRIFDNDDTVDRQSVELCVELFTEDVLTSVATEEARGYQMAMYKKHPNGVDRWFPVSNTVVLHTVDPPAPAPAVGVEVAQALTLEPEIEPTIEEPVLETAEIEPGEAAIEVESDPEPAIEAEAEVDLEAEVAAETDADVEASLPLLAATPPRWMEPEPTREMPMEDLDRLVAEASIHLPAPVAEQVEAVEAVEEIAVETAQEPAIEPEIETLPEVQSAVAEVARTSSAPVVDEHTDFSEGIDTSSLADEVAEAVRRALEAIDAAARPPASLRPEDIIGVDEDVRADSTSS